MGGLFGGGADDAAKAQERSAQLSARTQKEMFEQTREDLLPYMGAGGRALGRYEQLLLGTDPQRQALQSEISSLQALEQARGRGRKGFTDEQATKLADLQGQLGQLPADATAPDYSTFFKAPGYQFQLEEGQKSLERGAAARGGLLSGAALKASQRYGQGLASQSYENYMNRLSGMAGMGQSSAAQTGQFGAGAAQGIGAAQEAAGAARGSGYIGQQQEMQGLLQTGLGVAGMFLSDDRLKENIVPAGKKNGFDLYEFNYIGVPEEKFKGVIAQDIQETNPEAVFEHEGYLAVDYDKLGLTMEKVA